LVCVLIGVVASFLGLGVYFGVLWWFCVFLICFLLGGPLWFSEFLFADLCLVFSGFCPSLSVGVIFVAC